MSIEILDPGYALGEIEGRYREGKQRGSDGEERMSKGRIETRLRYGQDAITASGTSE